MLRRSLPTRIQQEKGRSSESDVNARTNNAEAEVESEVKSAPSWYSTTSANRQGKPTQRILSLLHRWKTKDLQETRLVSNVQHAQNRLKTLPVRGVHEGEEALYCEGTCQCWYHRWCVGVTGARFQVLSESNEPFLCQACISHRQHIIIQELQSCV